MPQGPLFETPQDVMARIRQQREAQYGSGNAAQIFQAQIGGLVDSLVGNPEVRRAREIDSKIRAKMGTPTGSEMEQEVQKLRAARDVYAEAGDLNRASMFNQQLLQMQVADLEQRKLKAETIDKEAIADVAVDREGLEMENRAYDIAKKRKDLTLGDPSLFVHKNSGDRVTLDKNNIEDMDWARRNGYIPATVSVQAEDLESITRKPLPEGVQERIDYGLEGIKTYDSMYSLTDSVKGLFDENGTPRPQAAVEWLGGKIGVNEAAKLWQVHQAKARADVQAIIRGNPSNRDASIFEALIPTFFDAQNVKKAKLDLLLNTQRRIIRNAIAYYRGTKQQVPNDMIRHAAELGVDVRDITALDEAAASSEARKISNDAAKQLEKISMGSKGTSRVPPVEDLVPVHDENGKLIGYTPR